MKPRSPDRDSPSLAAHELLAAANSASVAARNTWLAMMGLLAYLLVTLGSVTHKNLLLNEPLRLPVINVDMALFGFFRYAPLLLLLVQLGLLIQHVLLARKFHAFSELIEPQEREEGEAHPLRELVHSYVVSQVLAGPPRPLPLEWLMRQMIFVTFSLLPLVTLLYFQVRFLPYHDIATTYWHRIAIVLELALLFFIRPYIGFPGLVPNAARVSIGKDGWQWRYPVPSLVLAGLGAAAALFFQLVRGDHSGYGA